jgi:hypothetical protein
LYIFGGSDVVPAGGFVMASVPEIRERLKVVFAEAQAEVLAHVVGETRDDLVTRTTSTS